MSPGEAYEVWVIDPNDDDMLSGEYHNLSTARYIRHIMEGIYWGSGCRVELWQDGEPVKEED